MRTAALLLSFVAFGYAASAQKFSLLPQVGFENSKTVIGYNDLTSFSPLGVRFSPQASLRLNYSSKQGHGFFAGVATSRSTLSFEVPDAENVLSSYKTTIGSMQVRLEGGYQFSTQPIFFNKNKAKQAAVSRSPQTNNSSYRGSCSKKYNTYSRCGSSKAKQEKAIAQKSRGSWMRIQPSIGMGFIPAVKSDVITTTENGQTSYEYRAGNWNTALITGANFEFGKNSTPLFTVSLNYFNGMGNLGKRTITTVQAAKSTTTILQSDVSGWNMRVGIPFSLGAKKKTVVRNVIVQKIEQKKTEQQPKKTGCGEYRVKYRCVRSL